MPKPDNRERNARIIELANQGKPPVDIARELGVSRGVVLGVLHRARKAGKVALPGGGGGQGQEAAPGTPRPSDNGD